MTMLEIAGETLAQVGSLPGRGWRRLARLRGESDERLVLMLPLAVAVGIASGLSAVALRSGVHEVFHWLAGVRSGALGIALPAGGMVLGVLVVRKLFREAPGHGVPQVIRAVCRDGGRMPRRSILSRWVGSMLTVSAGGSAGLEAPIVFSAGALGSAIGGLAKVDERRRSVLLACGVAGGIAGIFNAPITGLVFAMEVVLAEWSALSIVPVVLAAVSATELSRNLLGNAGAFSHSSFEMSTTDLLWCVGLGIVSGFVSAALARTLRFFERVSEKLPAREIVAPAVLGLGVGVAGLVMPQAVGEGYETAQAAISGNLAAGVWLCAALALAKIVTTGLTLGSGAPGGVFAPCLVVGSVVGVCFSRAAQAVLPAGHPLAHEGSYALAGMSGLVAGVMHAPLTGILLVVEVTGGYQLILNLMLVAVISLVVARQFDRHSIYTEALAERGELLRPGTDRRILSDLRVHETLDQFVDPVRETMTLADFVEVVKKSKRNHFPVLRADGVTFAGILHLGDVRELLFDPELARLTLIGTVMDANVARVPADADLSDALEIFERTGAWVLPVVDGERFAGLLSKSTLFDHYRRELSVQAPG